MVPAQSIVACLGKPSRKMVVKTGKPDKESDTLTPFGDKMFGDSNL